MRIKSLLVGVPVFVLGVIVSCATAGATTITFSSSTSTFTNVGGIAGLNLSITCGTTAGTSCGDNGAANNNGAPSFTSGSGLGVQTRSAVGDTNAIQGFAGATGEFLVFTFTGATTNLQLTDATLSNASTGYVLNAASSMLGTAASNVALGSSLSFASNTAGTVFTFGTTTNLASFFVSSITFTEAIPEPATLGLMGAGLAGLCTLRLRKRGRPENKPLA